MRRSIVGGVAVFALVFFGCLTAAHADSFVPSSTRVGPNHDVTGNDQDGWDTSDFNAVFNAQKQSGQVMGNWEFETVNPFRTQNVVDTFNKIAMADAAKFLSSQQASDQSAARLTYFVRQTGDRDGDDHDDFNLGLRGASFTTGGSNIPTPEPASLVLLGSGIVGLGLFGLRHRKARAAATR